MQITEGQWGDVRRLKWRASLRQVARTVPASANKRAKLYIASPSLACSTDLLGCAAARSAALINKLTVKYLRPMRETTTYNLGWAFCLVIDPSMSNWYTHFLFVLKPLSINKRCWKYTSVWISSLFYHIRATTSQTELIHCCVPGRYNHLLCWFWWPLKVDNI